MTIGLFKLPNSVIMFPYIYLAPLPYLIIPIPNHPTDATEKWEVLLCAVRCLCPLHGRSGAIEIAANYR